MLQYEREIFEKILHFWVRRLFGGRCIFGSASERGGDSA